MRDEKIDSGIAADAIQMRWKLCMVKAKELGIPVDNNLLELYLFTNGYEVSNGLKYKLLKIVKSK